jgi:AhpD family alkylhydroperoxidase
VSFCQLATAGGERGKAGIEEAMFDNLKRRFESRVERRIVAMGFDRVKFIRPVRPEAASGLVAAVYDQLGRDFQLLAPLTLMSPLPQLLAASWIIMRETLLAGAIQRHEKELVAEAVSKANECPYCVAAHALMLRGGDHDKVGEAVARGDTEAIDNPRLRALATWALNSKSPDHPAVLHPPFDDASAPEVVGTAVVFHMVNRMVDVFLERTPFALPSGMNWAAALLMRPLASTFARRVVGLSPRQGESLSLLADFPLPTDLRWAASNPVVAGAFARASSVVEQLGASFVPEEARAIVLEHTVRWRGEAMGPNRAWVEEATRAVSAPARPAACLALLTAFAPYQVEDTVVTSFRERSPSDEALLATVGWAAFTAARRVGTWLGGPLSPAVGGS